MYEGAIDSPLTIKPENNPQRSSKGNTEVAKRTNSKLAIITGSPGTGEQEAQSPELNKRNHMSEILSS